MRHDNNAEIPLNKLLRTVDSLKLSVRSGKCLKRANIVYLRDLVQKTASELLSWRNLGRKSLAEIEEKLGHLGLSLGMKIHGGKPDHDQGALRPFTQRLEEQKMWVCPVDLLELSIRSRKCLERANICYLGDLVQKTESELLGYRNFGRKSLAELKEKLGHLGLSLGMLIEGWPPDNIDQVSKLFAQELVEKRMREAERDEKDLNAKDTVLEEELRHLTDLAKSERNKQIIHRYFGLDGGVGMTLQAIGEEFGMSRERVRQICSRFENAVQRKVKTMRTPILDRTLKFVAEYVPADAEQIENELVAQGMVRTSFRIEGLVSAAELLHRSVKFHLEKVEGRRLVVKSEFADTTKLILQAARKAIEHWGVATVADIAAQVRDITGRTARPEFVSCVVKILKDFQWLEEESGWFWLPSVPRNRLITQIQKILSVAGSVDISELRAGISRSHRMDGFAPPRRVLLAFCRRLSWCQVQRDMIIVDQRLDWEEILAESEWAICYVLKEYGPLMAREKLEEMCLELGMNRNTFWQYLTYSPIVTRYAPGVYGLRGSAIPPGVAESLRSKQRLRQRRGKVLVDYGWTPDGKIWLAYKISQGMIRTGVFCIPAAMQQYLKGIFTLRTADGAHIGNLKTKGSAGWSLLKLFGRRGGEPGDYAVLLFALSSNEVRAQIGDVDLLDDFRNDASNEPS